jgi:hypothetical protein
MRHKLVVVVLVRLLKYSMKLVEGIDYYIEEKSGLMVLTSLFLLKRGFCCSNGCKNCPYDPPNIIKGNTKVKEST